MGTRRCKGCGYLVTGAWWCARCKAARKGGAPQQPGPVQKGAPQPRATTTERGYGGEWQKARRAALAAHVDGDPCGFCGQGMFEYQPLDLDHSVPLVLGGDGPARLAHARCNRAAGARLGNRRRVGRVPLPPQPPKPRGSRDW